MTKQQQQHEKATRTATTEEQVEDDGPDEWDQRIFSTGCQAEQARMNDCYYDQRDWRKCAEEMTAFRECWKRNGNNERTATEEAYTE